MPNLETLLREGLSAAKAGDLNTARKLLSQYVQRDPKSETAWLVLGYSLVEKEKKAYCFRMALKLNPKNETARRLLRELQEEMRPASDRTAGLTAGEPDGKKKPQRNPALLAGGVIGVTLVILLTALIFDLGQPPAIFDRIASALLREPGAGMENPAEPGRTLPATWTLTPELTTTPTFTATPTAPLSYSEQVVAVYDEIRQAERLMENSEYAEAILVWDVVIAAAPDYAHAYRQRGWSYYWLTENQRVRTEAREYAEKAYEDLSRAIELSPFQGDYYSQRAFIEDFLANTYDFQAETDSLRHQAHLDVLKAYELGHTQSGGNRNPGYALSAAGLCEEALDFFLRLEEARADEGVSGQVNEGLARVYNCLRQPRRALDHIDIAISVNATNQRLISKAKILTYLGRYQDSNEILNDLIAQQESYGGYRYYLRALNYYYLNEPELALLDLNRGATQTWNQHDIRALLLAILAREEGDTQSAIEYFQLAEASITPNDPFYDIALAGLQELGGEFLYPTTPPEREFAATPVPVISDAQYATPTPVGLMPRPIFANYLGTGPIIFDPFGSLVILFQPGIDPQIAEIKSLTVRMDGGAEGEEVTLLLQTIAHESGGSGNPTNLSFGEHPMRNSASYVDENGYIYLSIRNFGDQPVVVENFSIRLVVILPDGSEIVHGYR